MPRVGLDEALVSGIMLRRDGTSHVDQRRTQMKRSKHSRERSRYLGDWGLLCPLTI
jgi:hypothetical protein